ncbi:DNA repair protein RecN [Puniceicoccaceae bacterium K14]|nr:DNA repair protein RecN [Puniceicoccaceae bacterium K14]
MLQYLKITNLALLESASIEFDHGFTVVTGETGAGKSVLLGALSLLAGSRSDKTKIRSGEDLCTVEASLYFEDSDVLDAELQEMGFPKCEEGLLILKRTLHRKKPSRISINGSIATLANLQQLGGHWIDFHGPGEPQRLLQSECQLEMIDLYAKLEREAGAYRADYGHWREVLGKLDRLWSEESLSLEQVDFLRSQIERIDQLELTEEAIEQLETDFNRVSSSQELLGLANSLSDGLTGDEGALNVLSQLSRSSSEAAELDPSLENLSQRLDSLILEVQELGNDYDLVGSSLNFEPEFAAEVEAKMSIWQELRRKYGRDVKDVQEARDAMEKRIDEQSDIEGTLNRLQGEADSLESTLRAQAAKLSTKRLKAGKTLAKEAEGMLLDLGFKKGRCSVELVKDKNLKPYGDALPELQFSPNVGEPLQPLAKVASSGELARVMLALKSILAKVDRIPVLVFDEVDANVGGEIGRVVGEKMRQIANSHQVFCITHLPQVAAIGQSHFLVEKDQSGARATVSISQLEGSGEERVLELARMLGDRNATAARSHAKDLLAG